MPNIEEVYRKAERLAQIEGYASLDDVPDDLRLEFLTKAKGQVSRESEKYEERQKDWYERVQEEEEQKQPSEFVLGKDKVNFGRMKEVAESAGIRIIDDSPSFSQSPRAGGGYRHFFSFYVKGPFENILKFGNTLLDDERIYDVKRGLPTWVEIPHPEEKDHRDILYLRFTYQPTGEKPFGKDFRSNYLFELLTD